MRSNPEVSKSFNTFHVCEAPVTIFFCLLLPVRPNGLTQGVPATANGNDGNFFLLLSSSLSLYCLCATVSQAARQSVLHLLISLVSKKLCPCTAITCFRLWQHQTCTSPAPCHRKKEGGWLEVLVLASGVSCILHRHQFINLEPFQREEQRVSHSVHTFWDVSAILWEFARSAQC